MIVVAKIPVRRLALAVLLVAAVGCASSSSSSSSSHDTIGGMRMFMQPRSLSWDAAVVAMHDIGARIIVQNRSAGLLAGEVRRGELGGRVRIDVTVRASSSMPGEERNTGSDISVTVMYQGGTPNEPGLQDELRDLRDEYLDAVETNLGTGRRRYR